MNIILKTFNWIFNQSWLKYFEYVCTFEYVFIHKYPTVFDMEHEFMIGT